jgi:3-phosphoshikimate 1-carboxyvinyltransferase
VSEPHVVRHVAPARRVRGRVVLPGDKSISHRYALLGAIADGLTTVERYAPGQDCASTLSCLAQLGVLIERPAPGHVVLHGRGLRGLGSSDGVLDAGNSGSTLRMLSGILAGHPFASTITGDASLRRRPMRRIVAPLERMGATLEHDNGRPPLTIHGTAALQGIHFVPDVASAQVKSAVLLAGLHATGSTTVREPALTRDHTERALVAFGLRPAIDGLAVTVAGGQRLTSRELRVPGDASSAAFWAVAAAGLPGSEVELADVGLNPTRTAFLDVLQRTGARVARTTERTEAGEPIGTVVVSHGTLRPVQIGPEDVPGLIDELPVLAALATFGGAVSVTGAAELRAKESDRISALIAGLRAMGADADELPDGFHVRACGQLSGGTVDACGDHRLAMAFAVAALGAAGPTVINGAEAVDVSYPGFFETLGTLCAEGR